jgi:hypothetical protein
MCNVQPSLCTVRQFTRLYRHKLNTTQANCTLPNLCNINILILVSYTYCVLFLFGFSLSCVPYVASFSGLFLFLLPLRYSLTFIKLVESCIYVTCVAHSTSTVLCRRRRSLWCHTFLNPQLLPIHSTENNKTYTSVEH